MINDYAILVLIMFIFSVIIIFLMILFAYLFPNIVHKSNLSDLSIDNKDIVTEIKLILQENQVQNFSIHNDYLQLSCGNPVKNILFYDPSSKSLILISCSTNPYIKINSKITISYKINGIVANLNLKVINTTFDLFSIGSMTIIESKLI